MTDFYNQGWWLKAVSKAGGPWSPRRKVVSETDKAVALYKLNRAIANCEIEKARATIRAIRLITSK